MYVCGLQVVIVVVAVAVVALIVIMDAMMAVVLAAEAVVAVVVVAAVAMVFHNAMVIGRAADAQTKISPGETNAIGKNQTSFLIFYFC